MMNHISNAIIDQFLGTNHCIYLPPLPQARHRTNGNRTYDPHARHKLAFRLFVIAYLKRHDITDDMLPLTQSNVQITLSFYIRRPSHHFVNGDRTSDIRAQFENTMPTTTGDIDNYVKFFLDATNGIFFPDDRNVVSITASKHYCRGPGRTVYNIRRYEMNLVDLTTGNVDNNDENRSEVGTEVTIINIE